jgi:hypothetical protein
MQVETFAHIVAVVMAMSVYEIKFCGLKFYFFSPDLRRIKKKRPVETAPVATTPITPAAPVDRRELSTPLTP